MANNKIRDEFIKSETENIKNSPYIIMSQLMGRPEMICARYKTLEEAEARLIVLRNKGNPWIQYNIIDLTKTEEN
jgi:hypothetical protein